MAEITTKKVTEKIENAEKAEKELREAFVPIDPNNQKNDTLPVFVNGKGYLVKRGVTAHVPPEVYEVLKIKRLTLR